VTSGINKPYDRILKTFADEAPSLFLRLLGFVPAGVEPDIQPLRPETTPAVVFPDYVAVVRIGHDPPIIFHAEFQANYYREIPNGVARYGGSLAWQYLMPMKSVVVMLRPRGVPAKIPRAGVYSIGDTRTTHPFKVVRLWEIDPEPVLETNNPRLLAWALLLKSTDRKVQEIASILVGQDDEELLGIFLMLGSLRYDRDTLNEMIGGGKMGLIKAILDGSSLVQEEREQAAARGRAEGEARGAAKGRAEEARRILRRLLSKNFPELESLAEIDEIASVEVLESLMDSALEASGADTVRAAILAAAKPN
jgi:hypothetical protein